MTADPSAHRLSRSACPARLDAVLLVKVGVAVSRKSGCRLTRVVGGKVGLARASGFRVKDPSAEALAAAGWAVFVEDDAFVLAHEVEKCSSRADSEVERQERRGRARLAQTFTPGFERALIQPEARIDQR